MFRGVHGAPEVGVGGAVPGRGARVRWLEERPPQPLQRQGRSLPPLVWGERGPMGCAGTANLPFSHAVSRRMIIKKMLEKGR